MKKWTVLYRIIANEDNSLLTERRLHGIEAQTDESAKSQAAAWAMENDYHTDARVDFRIETEASEEDPLAEP